MAPAKLSKEEIAAAYVDNLFDDAYAIREEYTGMLERRDANRSELRNARKAGRLNPEQLEMLEELYPTRLRKDAEEDESEEDETADGEE